MRKFTFTVWWRSKSFDVDFELHETREAMIEAIPRDYGTFEHADAITHGYRRGSPEVLIRMHEENPDLMIAAHEAAHAAVHLSRRIGRRRLRDCSDEMIPHFTGEIYQAIATLI